MRPLADPGRPTPIRRPAGALRATLGALRLMPSLGGRRQSREDSREAAVQPGGNPTAPDPAPPPGGNPGP